MIWDRKGASPKTKRGHETMTKSVWKKGKIKIWQRPVFLKKYCWKKDIPSNLLNQKNNNTYWTNFLRPSTLLLCKKIFCLWKNKEKWTLSFFLRDLRHQIFHSSNSNIRARGIIWWHEYPEKNDKVHLSVSFD